MKRFFVLVFLAMLLLPISNALVEVSVDPIKDSILLGNEASFNVTVKNVDDSKTGLEVYTQSTNWILRRSPHFSNLDSGEERSFILYFNHASGTSTGPKGVDVSFKTSSDEKRIKEQFYIYLTSGKTPLFDYNPSVKINAEINENNEVDPRDKVKVKVELKNRNPLVFDDLKVLVSSDYFSDRREISLNSFEETTEYFEFDIDSTIKPRQDSLYIQLQRNNDTFEDETFVYDIVAFSPFFKKKTFTDNFFMGEKTTINLTNTGNIKKEETFKIPVTWFSKFFYDFEQEGNLVDENGELFYSWEVVLEPQETFSINYVVDYRLLFYSGAGLILAVILYFVFRSPIVLRKEVYKVQKREGGIYELKVILYVKNRSRKVVNNLQLFDRVPHLAEVIRESYLGSIKPDRVLKDKNKGSMIKWLLPNIESLEERIITYKIRSKFTILGKLVLPRARAKFVTKSSKIRVTYSNSFKIETDQ